MVSRTCVWFSTCTLKFTPSTPRTCWRGAHTYRRVRESCTGLGRLNNESFFYHASRLSPVMDCTSPATSGYICKRKKKKNENQMSVCVCKLICNLCKEHYMLENSCVTASFPFLSSLLFFLFSISFPRWAITHTAGCVAASATPHADVPGSADRQHPELCLLLRYQLSIQAPLSEPVHDFSAPQIWPPNDPVGPWRNGKHAKTTRTCYGSYI